MSNHLLLVLTFDGDRCSVCVTYKQIYQDDFTKFCINEYNLSIVNLNIEEVSRNTVKGITIHPQLIAIAKWAPLFVLVTKESWSNIKMPLDYSIFNSVSRNGILAAANIETNLENLKSWVTRELPPARSPIVNRPRVFIESKSQTPSFKFTKRRKH